MGTWGLWARWIESVLSAAIETVSAAAVSNQVFWRAGGARREEARMARISGAAGNHLAIVQGSSWLHALRLLRSVRLRMGIEVFNAGNDDSDGRKDRPLRNPS